MKAFRFHPEALTELLAILRWYDERFPAAADALAAAVEGGIESIRRVPHASPPVFGEHVHARNLRKYGYSIIYEVGDEIVVLAIAHQRRRARYWLGRARDD